MSKSPAAAGNDDELAQMTREADRLRRENDTLGLTLNRREIDVRNNSRTIEKLSEEIETQNAMIESTRRSILATD
jgi:hypothetical protein